MTAAWMAFAALTGSVLTVAALAAERVAAAAARPRRWVWVVALLATAGWPVGVWLADASRGAGGSDRRAPEAPTVGRRLPTFVVPVPGAVDARSLDAVLLGGWALAGAVLLARLVLGATILGRARRAWPAAEVDGVRVLVAPNAGPAVVGLRRPAVVLPAWALALDSAERALVLRHEAEHQTARDPYALLLAALLPAFLPWHPAVWWQARRLRLAVELDCDARVLRGDARPAGYARLLVLVAERRSAATAWPAPAVAALLAPTSHLERRLHAMRTAPRPARLLPLRAVAFGGGVLAAVAAACAVEPPASPQPPQSRPSAAPATRAAAAPSGGEFLEFKLDVEAAPRRLAFDYPAALKAARVEGRVDVRFVVDTTGRVEPATVRVLRSTDPAFTAAVQAGLARTEFTPARAGGRAVRQLVQIPIAFTLDASGAR